MFLGPPLHPASRAHTFVRYRSSAPEEANLPFLLRYAFKRVVYLSQDLIPKVVTRALESHGKAPAVAIVTASSSTSAQAAPCTTSASPLGKRAQWTLWGW